jgi:ABC-type multidrug transport system permease subunit
MMSDTEFQMLVDSKKKSGVVAAILNLVIPGAGYVYCGRWVLGIVAFFLVIAMFVASFGFAAVGIALILIADGFLCAGRYNKLLVERMIQERHAKAVQPIV